jgi:hypothetical protein
MKTTNKNKTSKFKKKTHHFKNNTDIRLKYKMCKMNYHTYIMLYKRSNFEITISFFIMLEHNL